MFAMANYAGAKVSYEKAIEVQEAAARTAPTAISAEDRSLSLRRLARLLISQASGVEITATLGQARGFLDRALQIDRDRLAQDSWDIGALRDISLGMTLLAEADLRSGNTASARAAIEEALRNLTGITQRRPGEVDYQLSLAAAWFICAKINQADKRPNEAIDGFGKCRDILSRLIQEGKLTPQSRDAEWLDAAKKELGKLSEASSSSESPLMLCQDSRIENQRRLLRCYN
jgi:tetratricopeptide (TPR) repeat protein